MNRYYTTTEVARMLKTDPQIVRQKCREGHWPAIRPPGFRDWRIPIADFEKMLWDLEEDARNSARSDVVSMGIAQITAEGERVKGDITTR